MYPNKAGKDRGRYSGNEIKKMISVWLTPDRLPRKINIITDTSDFFQVGYDDVLVLDSRPYLVRNCEKEGRFGLDDEPKFWVRRSIDLIDGKTKIIKMVFHENFKLRVGQLVFDCIRSPGKEARILEKVRGHCRFMQGFSVEDAAGNCIRIIDYIKGKRLYDRIPALGLHHEDYFKDPFPQIFDEYIELVKAILFLHEQGEKHGDIRTDHLIMDNETKQYKWIDFDFNYIHRENPFSYDLFGLGNILVFITGQGDVTIHGLREEGSSALGQLTNDDMNIIFRHRVVNLKKVYPYIPDSLDYVLRHFSMGANLFYEDTARFLSDLMEVRRDLK
jgi:hypothetical protein